MQELLLRFPLEAWKKAASLACHEGLAPLAGSEGTGNVKRLLGRCHLLVGKQKGSESERLQKKNSS